MDLDSILAEDDDEAPPSTSSSISLQKTVQMQINQKSISHQTELDALLADDDDDDNIISAALSAAPPPLPPSVRSVAVTHAIAAATTATAPAPSLTKSSGSTTNTMKRDGAPALPVATTLLSSKPQENPH